MILGLIHNISLVLALCLVKVWFKESRRWREWLADGRRAALIDGLLFGAMGILAMMTPLRFAPGIIFDARSIILGIAGLTGGPLVAGLSALICALYRIGMGGGGAVMGVGVILTSAGLGAAWRHWARARPGMLESRGLWLLGFLIHLAMVGQMALLPSSYRSEVFYLLALPVLVLYTIGTFLAAKVFLEVEAGQHRTHRLAQAQSRYQSLFHNRHTPMLVIDPQDGAIVEANPAAAQFYGWSQEELTRKKISQINTLDPEAIKQRMEAALEGSQNAFLFKHRLADGSLRDVEVHSGPVEVEGRRLLFSVIHDVTQRMSLEDELKRAQDQVRLALEQSERSRKALLSILEDEKEMRRALKESEGKYRLLAENVSDVIWTVDPKYRFTYISPSVKQLRGLSQEEAMAEQIADTMPPHWAEKAAKFIQYFMKRIEAGERDFNVRFEAQQYHKNGSLVWVEMDVRPLWDEQGNLLGAIGISRNIEERKLAQETLKASEERYRVFVNSTEDLAFLKDENLRYLMVNESYRRWFGKPLDEIIGHSDAELMPPQTAEGCARSDRLAMERNEVVVTEETAGGRIYETRKFPVPLEGGRLGVGGFIRDITEERQALQRLSESEQRYRNLVESMNEGLMQVDNDDNILFANHQICQMLGYEEKELLGRKGYSLAADDPEMVKLIMEKNRLRQQGVSDSYQVTMRRKDGRKIRLLISGSPVFDAAGRVIGSIGVFSDVTEEVEAQERLRQSEERFRSFFENIFVGIYRTTPDGKILMANPSLVRMLGYDSFEELSSRNLEQEGYEPGYTREEFKRNMAECSEMIGHEAPWKRKDGSVVWVRESVRVVRDENGEILYYEGTAEDITQRKKVEEEKALIEEELRQVQKIEAIGQLAGGVAHDFNNMLAGIMGNAEMLLGRLAQDTELAKYVEQIIAGAENAATLTRQLLDFARKGPIKKEPVDIHRLLEDAVGILSHTLDRRIQIEKHWEAPEPWVRGDRGLLTNAFVNLGINSRDAMPHGGRLIFSTRQVELDQEYLSRHRYKIVPGRYLKIEVTDTGCGMSPEVQAKIFEPFFTTKGPGKGTGLGLASVYGTVKSHGGSIECYSEPGHGTTMKIYLPVLEDRGKIKKAEMAEKSDRTFPLNITGTVLVVDDEELVRGMAEQILRSQGLEVLTAGDGEEALHIFRAWHREISLVVLDMIMPKMSGREVFLEMKKIDPGVRVVLSSGFSEEGEVNEIMNLGLKGFVQKPYSIKSLMAAIAKAME